MNILSLFDGMSCGQQALNRAGIKYNKYYASEIDKYAIQITMKNYPDTIQLGDITKIKGKDLPKIDMIMGGSPCQGFSIAGKQMKFKDPRSALIYDYFRLLKECKPKYFLLENVRMATKCENVITEKLKQHPCYINSALLSAQNRERIYWTNINATEKDFFEFYETGINQPKDKGILIKDIIDNEVDEKYFLSDKMFNYLNTRKDNFNSGKINYKTENDKASCINKSSGSLDISDNIIIHNMMPRNSKTGNGGTGHLMRKDVKSYCLDTGKTNAVEIKCGNYRYDEGFRWRKDKSVTLQARAREDISGIGLINNNNNIRRLTPIECERLQTVEDNYTSGVSDSQRYKMLGNGWTIDVIVHIFKHIGGLK
jgi:DNA-cytosine methyltransferase